MNLAEISAYKNGCGTTAFCRSHDVHEDTVDKVKNSKYIIIILSEPITTSNNSHFLKLNYF